MNGDPIPLEEILIREAVARIRKWLRQKGRGEEGIPPPRIAVRFCGGCNPVIERGWVVQRIREELAGEVTWVSRDEKMDLLLIVNGCPTACSDRDEIPLDHPMVVVSGDSVFTG